MVAFAAALIMSLNELNLKLWGNTEFMCETYTAAKTFGQLMFSWVTNNFKLPYTHHVLAKLKQESRFLSPYKFTASTFLRLKLQFQQHFSDVYWCKWKRNFIISKPSNCTVEKFSPNRQLEVINLKCIDILKGKYQKRNLTESC